MKGINGHDLPPELRVTGRLSDALAHARKLKSWGHGEKAIARAILKSLSESKTDI